MTNVVYAPRVEAEKINLPSNPEAWVSLKKVYDRQAQKAVLKKIGKGNEIEIGGEEKEKPKIVVDLFEFQDAVLENMIVDHNLTNTEQKKLSNEEVVNTLTPEDRKAIDDFLTPLIEASGAKVSDEKKSS